MKLTFCTEDAFVYDDVLRDDAFEALWRFLNTLSYRSIAADAWAKVWNIGDGTILHSRSFVTSSRVVPRSDSPLDGLLDAVTSILPQHDALQTVGRLAVTAYVWPPVSGISWHSDGASAPDRVGAFSFYAHKSWNAEWGGEFLLSSEHGTETATPFDNTLISQQVLDRGIGTWIAPKPNRLVFVMQDVLHKVVMTQPRAQPRLSLQGFLLRE